MKKRSFLAFVLLITSIYFFSSSCKKDATSTSQVPVITPVFGIGLISSNAVVDIGSDLKIVFFASGNSTTNANISSITVTAIDYTYVPAKPATQTVAAVAASYSANPTVNVVNLTKINSTARYDTIASSSIIINKSSHDSLSYQTSPLLHISSTDSIVFTITITDVNQNSASKTIYVKGRKSNIIVSDTVKIGAQNSTSFGSFFASSNYTAYFSSQTKNIASSIDFIYYSDSTNHSILGAPADTNFRKHYIPYSSIISQFGGYYNITGFYDITTAQGITAAAVLYNSATYNNLGQYANTYNTTNVFADANNNIQTAITVTVGNYYMFKTAAGSIGIFQVNNIIPGSNGYITLYIRETN